MSEHLLGLLVSAEGPVKKFSHLDCVSKNNTTYESRASRG